MKNYLSIDFESWAYPDLPEFKKLTSQQRKKLDKGFVKISAEQILPLLKKHQTKLTFFVLGQLFDWYPKTIERIAAEGHEIAYHTYIHEILKTKRDLVNSLAKSEKFIKRFKPKGFRAPVIYLNQEYYPVLKDYGFQYSSSTYGPFSARKKIGGIIELPVTNLSKLPIGSGYFAALLGKKIGWFYRSFNLRGDPFISFVHNWQIVKPLEATFPHRDYLLKHPHYLPYTFEIRKTFEHLLKGFSFEPMKELIKKRLR